MYTKVSTAKFFQDLGFYEIARVENTLSFLENRKNGFARFCARLSQSRTEEPAAAIVMNANPFTLGHLALAERAAAEFPAVHLFVLEEDASLVPFAVRWKLVTEGVAHLPHVICHKSGPYLISSATFPSYFLKDEGAVIQGHARLDLALFGQIAQALNVTARYAGEEPSSQVTGLYNRVMAQELPKKGIRFVEVPRASQDGVPISASTVRKLIHDGNLGAHPSTGPGTHLAVLPHPGGPAGDRRHPGCRERRPLLRQGGPIYGSGSDSDGDAGGPGKSGPAASGSCWSGMPARWSPLP